MRKINHDAENLIVDLDLTEDALGPCRGLGRDHDVFNLTKEEEEPPSRGRFQEVRTIPDIGRYRMRSGYAPDRGDVLFITNAGSNRPARGHRNLREGSLPEYVLKARKMCPVKI